MYDIIQDIVKISITMSGIVLYIMSDIVLKNEKPRRVLDFFFYKTLQNGVGYGIIVI